MSNDSKSVTRDRIVTMITGIAHFGKISTTDLFHGLEYTPTKDDLLHFSILLKTGEDMAWIRIDNHGYISLTDEGYKIAAQLNEVLQQGGYMTMADAAAQAKREMTAMTNDDPWGDTNGYSPFDDAPEYPEDWPS